MKMQICETFVSHAGEVNVGRFAFFIRLAKCNLRCGFCDSPYAKESYVDIQIDDMVKQAEHFPRVVITGGEPLLQIDEIIKFIEKLKKKNPDVVIEIETNGTIKPRGNALKDIVWNVSPKLKNSGHEYKERINGDAINWFIMANANFKFVVNDENDIDEVVLLVHNFGIRKRQVFLMPQGKTKEEQLAKMEPVIKLARKLGYNFSPRLHVLIYGNKRGV